MKVFDPTRVIGVDRFSGRIVIQIRTVFIENAVRVGGIEYVDDRSMTPEHQRAHNVSLRLNGHGPAMFGAGGHDAFGYVIHSDSVAGGRRDSCISNVQNRAGPAARNNNEEKDGKQSGLYCWMHHSSR